MLEKNSTEARRRKKHQMPPKTDWQITRSKKMRNFTQSAAHYAITLQKEKFNSRVEYMLLLY